MVPVILWPRRDKDVCDGEPCFEAGGGMQENGMCDGRIQSVGAGR